MSEEPRRTAPGGAGLRASDEDREQLISELHDHAVAGRLTTEELEDRTGAAYGARTLAELDVLRRDLPATPESLALSHAARRSHLTRRLIQETGGAAGLFVVCTAIWLVDGAHHGAFWPVWVLIVVVLSLVRNGWALWGPAPDLDAMERNLDARHQRRLQRGRDRSQRRDRRLGP